MIEVQVIDHGNVSEKINVPDELLSGNGDKTIRILSSNGDERLTWNSGSLKELREAESIFNELVAKGLKPYYVDSRGNVTSEQMDEFNPMAEEIVFIPQQLVMGG